MQDIKQIIAICTLTLAFWGIMYPQFSLIQETYVCIEEDAKKDPREDFFAILDAGCEKIEIKSKVWELWKKNK